MMSLIRFFGFSAACLMLSSCATPPPKGSSEEAVHIAWERFCKSGYCEGYHGSIIDKAEEYITVSINGNTRYLRYTVSGEPGNYVVNMRPIASRGRTRP